MKLAFTTSTALLALLLAGLSHAQSPEAAAPPKGVRMFSCGHSFHMFVVPILQDIAKGAGIKDHVVVGKSSIGGSRVIQHWDVKDEKNEAKKALTAGNVDVLTLAPIWMPDTGIDNFSKLAFEHNPNIRILVQEFWMPNDTYEPKYPLDTRKKVDHDATNLADLKKAQDAYDHDVDEYARGINKQLGKDALVTVPVGQAAVLLREKIAAGQAPGLTKGWDLFRDTWGHPQAPLQVLDGYCHYAVIYKRSPAGLPVPLALSKTGTPETREKLNRLLQELAWEAVIHHPMSGVTAEVK